MLSQRGEGKETIMRRRGSTNTRRVHIGEDTWTYRIGRHYIQIWSPEGEKFIRELRVVVGEEESTRRATEKQVELADQWLENNYRGWPVYPSDVKQYISTVLRP